ATAAPLLLTALAQLVRVFPEDVLAILQPVTDDPRAHVQGDDYLGLAVGEAEVVLPALVLDLVHGDGPLVGGRGRVGQRGQQPGRGQGRPGTAAEAGCAHG